MTPVHVMDQLRHLTYNAPKNPHPWDPHRARSEGAAATSATAPNTPDSVRSSSGSNRSSGLYSPTENLIAQEIRHSPERGHPNICKLLDFFEDRDFYYRTYIIILHGLY